MSLESKVKSLMVGPLHKIRPSSSAFDAARVMLEKDVGSLVVSGIDGPIGIITERDILRKVTSTRADPGLVRVRDVMSSPLITVNSAATIGDAARKMVENRIKRLVVVEGDDAPVGIVTMTDIVRWVAKQEELSDSLIHYLMYNVP